MILHPLCHHPPYWPSSSSSKPCPQATAHRHVHKSRSSSSPGKLILSQYHRSPSRRGSLSPKPLRHTLSDLDSSLLLVLIEGAESNTALHGISPFPATSEVADTSSQAVSLIHLDDLVLESRHGLHQPKAISQHFSKLKIISSATNAIHELTALCNQSVAPSDSEEESDVFIDEEEGLLIDSSRAQSSLLHMELYGDELLSLFSKDVLVSVDFIQGFPHKSSINVGKSPISSSPTPLVPNSLSPSASNTLISLAQINRPRNGLLTTTLSSVSKSGKNCSECSPSLGVCPGVHRQE